MSKMQDALRKAVEDRDLRHEPRPADAVSGTHELWQEVRRLESSLANWTVRPVTSPNPAQPSSSVRPPTASSGNPAELGGRGDAVAAGEGTPVPVWKDALKQCESQLSAYDEQIVRRLEEQATLETQVEVQERAAAQARTALTALQQRLADTQHAVKSAEADRLSVQRKLEALRECQKLSDASQASEQELRATDEMIVNALDYQQRVADKLAQYRQHRQTVQRTTEGLRHQLQQAVARMETNGAYGDAAHE